MQNNIKKDETPDGVIAQYSDGAKRAGIAHRNKDLARQLWDGKLTDAEKKLLWEATEYYGLDPYQREICVMGGNLYITCAAMVKIAVRTGDYGGCQFVELGRDEIKHVYRYKCIVKKRVHGDWCEFEGIGQADPGNTKITWFDEMAQKRALARALRNAFAIGIPATEEMDMIAPPHLSFEDIEQGGSHDDTR